MRKLVSRREKEKSIKRNKIIWGVLLVFVMFISTLGFAFQGGGGGGGTSESRITYKGIEFVFQNGYWRAGNFIFKNNPKEVDDIGTVFKTASDFQNLPLYIYSQDDLAELEIYNNMKNIAERIQTACVEGEECDGDFPIKSCTDNFIIIKEDINSNIVQEDNCIYISGPEEDLVKLADQFLFKVLGVR